MTDSKSNPDPRLTHIAATADGHESRMVDVGGKTSTARSALARARIRFPAGHLDKVLAGDGPKGAVTEIARAAGVLGAKRTGDLIPMCHPLGLDVVDIRYERVEEDVLEIRCRAKCTGPTGVEMESLVGVALSALTVYDMTKGLSKGIRIEALELLEKTGGKSGDWRSPGFEAESQEG